MLDEPAAPASGMAAGLLLTLALLVLGLGLALGSGLYLHLLWLAGQTGWELV